MLNIYDIVIIHSESNKMFNKLNTGNLTINKIILRLFKFK